MGKEEGVNLVRLRRRDQYYLKTLYEVPKELFLKRIAVGHTILGANN